MSTPLIACTRMYNASESVAGYWESLVAHIAQCTGIALTFERHPFPLDIEALWQRPDLGLSFICGRAFALYGKQHRPLAVPRRKPLGSTLYHSKLLVRTDSPWTQIKDAVGAGLSARLGITVHHSHSGYVAVKRFLDAQFPTAAERTRFVEIGPLHTPANCLKALLEKQCDIAPLDAYYYELLQNNAPEKLVGTRVLAVSDDAPMPLFIASPYITSDVCLALTAALEDVAHQPVMHAILDKLQLIGFARPNPSDYDVLGDN